MKGLILGMALLASPAMAQDAGDTRLKLWGDVRQGMTSKEVKAVLPKRRITLNETCVFWVLEDTDRDRGPGIQRVKFSSSDSNPACADLVFDGLRAKYGEPVSKTFQEFYDTFSGPMRADMTNYVFRKDGLRVEFNRNPQGVYTGAYTADLVADTSGKL